jgi:hypothetical protein
VSDLTVHPVGRRPVQVGVETGVRLHGDDDTAAWVLDHRWFGLVGIGQDEQTALDDLRGRAFDRYRQFLWRHEVVPNPLPDVEVVERIQGDEQAFAFDRARAVKLERDQVDRLLRYVRIDVDTFLDVATDAHLDHDEPRELPTWSSWRTAREVCWHLFDTDSRYYLPRVGVEPRPREADLRTEAAANEAHVRRWVADLEAGRTIEHDDGEVWTTRKVLRRLAWHAVAELDVLWWLRARALVAAGDPKGPLR